MGQVMNRSGHVSRHKDWEYQKNLIDMPPVVDIRESILETRRVYADMDDASFAAWYSNRYRVKESAILSLLQGNR